MDAETIFFTLFVIWYFKQFHSSHHLIVSSIHFLKTAHDCINHYNELIRLEISNYNGDSASANDSESDASDLESAPDTVVVKYEDKYVQEVRRMEREFHFDNDADFSSKTMECLESIRATHTKRRTEISKILGPAKRPSWAHTRGSSLYTSTFESIRHRASKLISESLQKRQK
jgi:hypothetical protein